MNAAHEFEVTLKVRIRHCVEGDLPALEWFGLFQSQRNILYNTFERHQSGEVVMLVVEANGVTSGQAWLDLARKDQDATGFIWAVRIFPSLQNLGIGARLMLAAEDELIARGFERAELTVEKANPSARRFYERLGYREAKDFRTRARVRLRVPSHQWLLQKDLPVHTGASASSQSQQEHSNE